MERTQGWSCGGNTQRRLRRRATSAKKYRQQSNDEQTGGRRFWYRQKVDIPCSVKPKACRKLTSDRCHSCHARSIADGLGQVDAIDVNGKRTLAGTDHLDVPIARHRVANAEEPRFGGAAVEAGLAEIVNRQSGLRIDPNLATIWRCQ